MDYQLLVFVFLIPVFLLGFSVGRTSKEFPNEEEMMKRIIQGRIHKRISEQVETDVKNEIARQAAGGNTPY